MTAAIWVAAGRAVALALLPLIWVSAESAGDILLLGAAGASWAFPLLYLARSPWWARHVGRMLVAFTLALSLELHGLPASGAALPQVCGTVPRLLVRRGR